MALLLRPAIGFALDLEITYPDIGVAQPTDVPTMAIYFYALSLIVGVMICTLSLIFAGISWMLSSGNPGKLFAAKSQINAGFLGLAILLLSFVFLKVINPDLTIINLPTITSPDIPVPPPPPEPLPGPKNVFWELPFGFLEKKMLETTQSIISPINHPLAVQTAAKDVENKVKALKTAFDQCKCNNLKSDCGTVAVCKGNIDGCLDKSGNSPTQEDLCPNWEDIQTKLLALKTARTTLKTKSYALLAAQAQAKVAEARLNAAKGLLASCFGGVADLTSFLQIKDQKDVEKRLFFIDITDGEKQSLTFYCNLSEEYVTKAYDIMYAAISVIIAGLNRDYSCGVPEDCPEGTGYCSINNMSRYFSGNNAYKASIICQGESSGIPDNDNLVCPPDYSIGLMQINLRAHCQQAITMGCYILDPDKLKDCVETYHNPDENLKKAAALFAESGWYPWLYTASRCGLIDCEGGLGDELSGGNGEFSYPINNPSFNQEFTSSHKGMDLIGGLTVKAVADGVIEKIGTPSAEYCVNNGYECGILNIGNCGTGYGSDYAWGVWVAIKHNDGGYSLYAHLAYGSVAVSEGQAVSAGDTIGTMGSTGNSTGLHLHFEYASGFTAFSTSCKGNYTKPGMTNSVDPQPYFSPTIPSE